jgi:large repetitive protein
MPLRPPAGFISAFYDPLKNPDAPTSPSATAGDTTASVSFTAPANVGGSAITAYYAVSTPGQITGTAASSPVSVTGLTNGTSYTFNVWALNSYGPGAFSSATGSVTPNTPSDTAVFAGGGVTMDYVIITTTGNATSFGSLTYSMNGLQSGAASSTRGFVAGGYALNTINYFTIATTGNALYFGDLTIARQKAQGVNNSTRAVWMGGENGSGTQTRIDYFTMATTGNATTFGDCTYNTFAGRPLGAANSSTRGVIGGGYDSNYSNVIQYITTATTGNSVSFGQLTIQVTEGCGTSNATRGLFAGGYITGFVKQNIISYITIASTGNATSFGQLTLVGGNGSNNKAGASNTTRGLFAGGDNSCNTIEYVTIASTGNTTNFGYLTVGRSGLAGCSNANGGL